VDRISFSNKAEDWQTALEEWGMDQGPFFHLDFLEALLDSQGPQEPG
jgi:hypothetical protein